MGVSGSAIAGVRRQAQTSRRDDGNGRLDGAKPGAQRPCLFDMRLEVAMGYMGETHLTTKIVTEMRRE